MSLVNAADSQQASLSTDITVITAEINSYKQIAGNAIFEIGRRLKQVRDAKINSDDVKQRQLAEQRERFGGWIRWLSEHVDFDRTQAHRIVQSFEQFADVATSQRLPTNKIFEMLSLPSDVDRAEFVSTPHTIPSSGVTKTVDEMTVRELREVKAALRKAEETAEAERAAREQAESEAEVLRQTIESIEEQSPRTEYVRVSEDTETLRKYQARYGPLAEDDGVYRIKTETEISGTALKFSAEVREFLKEYAFLPNYESEFATLNDASAKEYANALEGLRNFVEGLYRAMSFGKSQDGIIIDI